MILEPVESSNIAAVGYDSQHSQLYVQFKHGGTYRYDEVPLQLHMKIMDAESCGKAFHALIKTAQPPFAFTKLEGTA